MRGRRRSVAIWIKASIESFFAPARHYPRKWWSGEEQEPQYNLILQVKRFGARGTARYPLHPLGTATEMQLSSVAVVPPPVEDLRSLRCGK